MQLVLASSSIYRRQLLERLQLPYTVAAPHIDESPLPHESPRATAQRLAIAKAQAVSVSYPNALIIGSDQVAHTGAQRFGKPGHLAAAAAQLMAMRGQKVRFESAICLLNTVSGQQQIRVVTTIAQVRHLSDAEIKRYLDKEHALDCAGSARSEGLGISLLSALHGNDPTALIGLPLITLCHMLRNEGIDLP